MTRFVEHYALGTFDDGSGPFAGLVAGDRVLRIRPGDLTDGLPTVRDLLEDWGGVRPRLADLAPVARQEGEPLEALRILPPLEPRQIFQAGANYRSHVAEIIISGKEADDSRSEGELRAAAEQMMDERARGGSPFFFAGAVTAMSGADDDVILVPDSQQIDWEAELTVVIGRQADRVPPEDALDYVAGYTVANDISARDLQFPAEHRPLGGDWWRAKNRPTFLPVGPWIVPADVLGDYRDLEVSLYLNGQQMQQDTAANMLFDVPRLVSQASAITPLLPGDLILTGSPAGNGGKWQRWLQPGDVMETSVSGIGTLRNTCR
ncbi:fumarylacetoacetate hydrolase family protein [Citricoccus sp.]|uniref:fumarylacetoacetate hydrolase family protein n=1 Tax=Citricoccus sp. TaxID=1978372 RepID=UPI0028BF01AA|nr:fumarylacetoacetate hydrolase family protein [Citricoccus sp.]